MKTNQELIQEKVYEKNGHQWIALENSHLDFSQKYLFRGFTKSGNVKIAEVYSTKNGGEPDSTRNRIAKVEDTGDQLKVWTDGWRYSLRINKEATQ